MQIELQVRSLNRKPNLPNSVTLCWISNQPEPPYSSTVLVQWRMLQPSAAPRPLLYGNRLMKRQVSSPPTERAEPEYLCIIHPVCVHGQRAPSLPAPPHLASQRKTKRRQRNKELPRGPSVPLKYGC